MIVEDHADFRDAHGGPLLGIQPDIDLLAKAGSLAEARDRGARLELDAWPSWTWVFPTVVART